MDRQDRLLFLLVKENDRSTSIREIADLFGVTARTIRNDIEALNDVLACNGQASRRNVRVFQLKSKIKKS